MQLPASLRNEDEGFCCEREEVVLTNTMIRYEMKKYSNFLRQ